MATLHTSQPFFHPVFTRYIMTDTTLPPHPDASSCLDLVYVTSIRTSKEIKALIARYGHLLDAQPIAGSSDAERKASYSGK